VSSPGSFEYLERIVRQELTPQEFGKPFFENCCQYFLRHAPSYRHQLEHVWLWDDWPGREKFGIDLGIDLVAETYDGDLWAVQAKGHLPSNTIPSDEVDKFLAQANRKFSYNGKTRQFAYGLLIATTENITSHSREKIENQIIPVGLVLRNAFVDEQLTWPTRPGEEVAEPRKASFKAWPHQRQARDAVVQGFQQHDRGQLILPCGTGKTSTGLIIAEALSSRRTVVLMPSLLLVSQTLREWTANASRPFIPVAVCSDLPSEQDTDNRDPAITRTSELGVPARTDPETIAQSLTAHGDDKPVVVFATYQSAHCLAEAQDAGAPPFDLLIADEAHRCAGSDKKTFALAVDGAKLRATRRLFMTATPRIFKDRVKKRAEARGEVLVGMDDPEHFGSRFYEMSFMDAINADPPLLTDYQVAIIGVNEEVARSMAEQAEFIRLEDGTVTDARTLAAQIILAKAMRDYDLRSVITFHTSITKAKSFVDPTQPASLPNVVRRMDATSRPDGELKTEHINGKQSMDSRRRKLKALKEIRRDTRWVVSNCACLSEGVDVPALDGIMFVEPKRSQIAIIQAVGRVMRLSETKKVGTILVPVFIDDSQDEEEVLSSSAFEPVWQIIKALRAHDRPLGEELDAYRVGLGSHTSGGQVRLPGKIKVDLPTTKLPNFEQAFYLKTLRMTTLKPDLTEERILELAEAHYRATGAWPGVDSGEVIGMPGETWRVFNDCLSLRYRGLDTGLSLKNFLIKHGRRDPKPELTEELILELAEAHYQATGEWPRALSGKVIGAPGETWTAFEMSLIMGLRGLPGKSSLHQLLVKSDRKDPPKPELTEELILELAEAHYQATGKWPHGRSGKVVGAPRETWLGFETALNVGLRGLPGKSSLHQLLVKSDRKDLKGSPWSRSRSI
jgi:predicted helicase